MQLLLLYVLTEAGTLAFLSESPSALRLDYLKIIICMYNMQDKNINFVTTIVSILMKLDD